MCNVLHVDDSNRLDELNQQIIRFITRPGVYATNVVYDSNNEKENPNRPKECKSFLKTFKLRQPTTCLE